MMSDKKLRPITDLPDPLRSALSVAISELKAKREALGLAQQAESRGAALLAAAEENLAAFGDVDAAIIQHRAGKFKHAAAAAGGPAPDMHLPEDLAARRHARNEALDVLTAAQSAHESLRADVAAAEKALERAERNVSECASAILAAHAAEQAIALKEAWATVWHQVDQLNALRGAWLPARAELPPDVVRLLQLIAGIDYRQWAGGKNSALARAGERWKAWHSKLCKDARAEISELSDDGASVRAVHRVA
jgi:hypothetical protein